MDLCIAYTAYGPTLQRHEGVVLYFHHLIRRLHEVDVSILGPMGTFILHAEMCTPLVPIGRRAALKQSHPRDTHFS